MAPRAVNQPGALVHFRHWDAAKQPKAGRPGVVDRAFSGNLALFYGSTFKRGGYPRDAIEIDPGAPQGDTKRELADAMPGFVDEPTFFHGSLLAETPVADEGLKHLAGLGFPNDLVDELQEQAEDRVLGFVKAWTNLTWLPMRARLLDALWWRAKLEPETELLLTLALCDGWSIAEIENLSWRDIDLQRGIVELGDGQRQLLPHTGGLLAERQRQSKGSPLWTASSRDDIIERLRLGWEALVRAAKPRQRRVSFPPWQRVLAKIDR